MREKYADVGLYIDNSQSIYAIPCGWDRITQKTVNTAEIDLLFILQLPYSNDDIEAFLIDALKNCYSKEREPGPGALAKHFGVKKWETAVKGMKCISFSWDITEGYHFMPHTKKPNHWYEPRMDKCIHLGANPQKGEIAHAFRNALEESTC